MNAAGWWLESGAGECPFCEVSLHEEVYVHCIHCDRPVCPICYVERTEVREISCPDCADQGGE